MVEEGRRRDVVGKGRSAGVDIARGYCCDVELSSKTMGQTLVVAQGQCAVTVQAGETPTVNPSDNH